MIGCARSIAADKGFSDLATGKIDRQMEMAHPLSMDSQSSSAGSVVCLFAGGNFESAAVAPSDADGAVTVGLGVGSASVATCARGTESISACWSVCWIGEGDSGALDPSASLRLDLYAFNNRFQREPLFVYTFESVLKPVPLSDQLNRSRR